MFGSTFIETAIGLSLMFLLMSLMCSVLCEAIAGWRRSRARLLFEAVDALVPTPGLAAMVCDHALIRALGATDRGGRWRAPSYVPSSIFARVVINLLRSSELSIQTPRPMLSPDAGKVSAYAPRSSGSPAAPATSAAEARARALVLSDLRVVLQALVSEPAVTLDVELAAIAGWFDASMERLSERYKRHSQLTVLALAVALTLGLNVDALTVTNRLQRDQSLRDAVVASAASSASEYPDAGAGDPTAPKPGNAVVAPSDVRARLVALEVQLEQLNLPIGWPTATALSIADERAKAADRVLAEAREDALVPASLWLGAREAANKAGVAVVAARANHADEKTISDLVIIHEATKAAAKAARNDDEAAKQAVAKALLVSEHLSCNLAEIKGRMLTFSGPTAHASAANFLLRFIGWLLTVLAVSIGARLWFDAPDKLVNIRDKMKPKEGT